MQKKLRNIVFFYVQEENTLFWWTYGIVSNLWTYLCVWAHAHACVGMFSHVWLFATPWIVAHEAPLSMEFSRQEYWSGLPFPS